MLGFAGTCLLPQQLDAPIAQRLAGLWMAARPRGVEALAEEMRALLGPVGEGHDLREAAREHFRMRAEHSLGRARALRFRAWSPTIRLDGLEHLINAREQGRGVVLWRMSFCSSPTTHRALWLAGQPLTHLSHEEHGAPSSSWLGRRVFAPLYLRAETPYLAERVLIPATGGVGYLRTLGERLEANAVVSILGEVPARQNIVTDFFERRAHFATGAPALAHRHGSVLLTSHAVREGPYRYRVVIDPPVDLDRSLPRREAVRSAVEQFSERLQHRIAEHPASWRRWGWTEGWLVPDGK